MPPLEQDISARIARLEKRLERERAVRHAAESIAEKGLRDLYDRQRELQLLARIAAAANQSGSIDEVLQFSMREVCGFTDWQVGHALMGDAQGLLCSCGIWHAAEPERVEIFREISIEARFAPGVGLPGRALKSREPHWIIDVTEDENFPRHKMARACGIKGAFAFPILSGEDVVAVLEFFSGTAREPDEGLLELMRQVGTQLGQVIERQRSEGRLRTQTEELRQARDEAKAADRAKSAFLANVSHELRTPLNAIIGFSEIMCEQVIGPIPERYRDYAGDIHSSGVHLKEVVNAIIDFTKIEAGALELKRQEVEIAALVAACQRIIAPLARKGGVALSVEVEAGLPPLIADEMRLKQILINLMSNAVKFTADGGSVGISAAREDGDCVITVRDTGIGMKPEEVAMALEPFRQIDSALSRRYEGTGLGLPLTKAIVELHGGRLVIDSMPGHGTSVVVRLPAARSARAA